VRCRRQAHPADFSSRFLYVPSRRSKGDTALAAPLVTFVAGRELKSRRLFGTSLEAHRELRPSRAPAAAGLAAMPAARPERPVPSHRARR
jgi:hypothetical protein